MTNEQYVITAVEQNGNRTIIRNTEPNINLAIWTANEHCKEFYNCSILREGITTLGDTTLFHIENGQATYEIQKIDKLEKTTPIRVGSRILSVNNFHPAYMKILTVRAIINEGTREAIYKADDEDGKTHNVTREFYLMPEVGTACTFLGWSDSHPGTVMEVSKSGKTIKVRRDLAKRIDNHGMSDMQDYIYYVNPYTTKEHWVTYRLNKKGQWTSHGAKLAIGYRRRYYDFSF